MFKATLGGIGFVSLTAAAVASFFDLLDLAVIFAWFSLVMMIAGLASDALYEQDQEQNRKR